jgi:Holliday junction resolvase RusA-like endonuclease
MTKLSPFTFSVPLLPPSVNHYKQPSVRGGMYRTREVTAFIDAVCLLSGRTRMTGNFYELELTFHLGPKKRNLSSNDLDNFLKVSLDALGDKGARIIVNDGRVLDLHVHKRFVLTDRDERTDFSLEGKQLNENEVFSGRALQSAPRSYSTEGSQTDKADSPQIRHASTFPEKRRAHAGRDETGTDAGPQSLRADR